MNKFVEEDELSDIPTKTLKPQGSASSATRAGTGAEVGGQDSDADVEFGSEKYMKSGEFLPVKPEKGQVIRFAFVPGLKLKHANVHYVEGIGSFRCLSENGAKAICCEKADKSTAAKDKFVGLVFLYTNADKTTGKLALDITPEIAVKPIRLSRANYREISELPDEGSNVFNMDLKMRHDETRAFGYKFTRIYPVPRWKQVEKLALELAEPYMDGVLLDKLLAKTLSKAELTQLLSGKGAVEARLSEMEDFD